MLLRDILEGPLTKRFMKSYSELLSIPSFDERLRYLQSAQKIGERSFGGDRYLNQAFYSSYEWRSMRHRIIVRDGGWDLAMEGYPVIKGYIHHINPIKIEELKHGDDCLFDPENLILCSFDTHNAIHFGRERVLPKDPIVRRPGDTCLWR